MKCHSCGNSNSEEGENCEYCGSLIPYKEPPVSRMVYIDNSRNIIIHNEPVASRSFCQEDNFESPIESPNDVEGCAGIFGIFLLLISFYPLCLIVSKLYRKFEQLLGKIYDNMVSMINGLYEFISVNNGVISYVIIIFVSLIVIAFLIYSMLKTVNVKTILVSVLIVIVLTYMLIITFSYITKNSSRIKLQVNKIEERIINETLTTY